MDYFKFCNEYRIFLEKWRKVQRRNETQDFSCGFAGYGPGCEKTIFFDNDKQKENYRIAYGF